MLSSTGQDVETTIRETKNSYSLTLPEEGLRQVKEERNASHPGKGVHWVTEADAMLPLKIKKEGFGSEAPKTVIQVMDETAKTYANHTALKVKRGGVWRTWTWRTYREDVLKFAASAIAVGVTPHAGVSILGFNSPEWVIADIGAIYAQAIPAGIYTTNGPDACHYIAHHCDAALVVVENKEQLDKILQVRARLPKLKAIVMWQGELKNSGENNVFTWNHFMQLANGNDEAQAELQRRQQQQLPNQCCTLIYTSGTTGNPKAVMLSHDNITWTASTGCNRLNFDSSDHLVSYLPLSHIAAQIIDIHGPMTKGATVWFAQPDALKGTLVETMNEVRPTFFLGVPRVWEKIEEKLKEAGAQNTGLKKKLGDWAKGIGLEGNLARAEGHDNRPWGWFLAETIVFNNVKKALGLDRCKMCVTGAAPIARQTLHYFMSLDINILELYGMSECTGPQTVSFPDKWKIGATGKAIDGVTMILDTSGDKVEKGGEEGEICYSGRHIFMGYMKNEEATKNAIDSNGFLHSGDIGRIDKEGFLYITGRIKELIITAGGENVPPVLIENVVKEELPVLSYATVIGDKKKYLSCLLTLRVELNEDGSPTNNLTPAALQAAKDCGSSATTVDEARNCSNFKNMIQEGINRYNARAISRAQHIRVWTILDGDFTIGGGELTPTTKTRRKIVAQKYAAQIADMYPHEKDDSASAAISKNTTSAREQLQQIKIEAKL